MMTRMDIQLRSSIAPPADAEAIGHLVFDSLDPVGRPLTLDAEALNRRRFTGKLGETVVLEGDGHLDVLVGVGGRKDWLERRLLQATGSFARAVSGCSRVALDLTGVVGPDVARAVQVAAEGAAGAAYRFKGYKSEDEHSALSEMTFVVEGGAAGEAKTGAARGAAIAAAVWLARDLGNTPAGDLTPKRMAEIASEKAGESGLEVTVFDESRIEQERLGGLLAVARGSAEPPRLVFLRYDPEPGADLPTVALVGKGITFDSGGLSLKTGDGMMAMKSDMSGAAAVVAALSACRELGVSVRVLGVTPLTENMPGGRATKPGDVFVARNGRSVEVLNTDAEGRLVLSDALSLAAEESPDAIIDLATLTGACVVALGRKMAGAMGNDSRLLRAVLRAGQAAGEDCWPLPLPEMYRADIESDVADMKNIGKDGRNAGALVAGLLLQEFVGDRPWVHLDIAGPARSEDDSYDLRKGSTGFGVRTLCELLGTYEPIGGPADQRAGELW